MKVRCDNCKKIYPSEKITVKSGIGNLVFVCDDCFKEYGLEV